MIERSATTLGNYQMPTEQSPYPQQDLADRLRQALKESGLTQAHLARACGVTEQSVHGWVTTGRISKQHLPTISALTGKSLDYFLVGLKSWRRVAALALPFSFLVPHFVAQLDALRGLACVLCKTLRRSVIRLSLNVSQFKPEANYATI